MAGANRLDNISKLIIIALIGIVVYFVMLLLLGPLYSRPYSMQEMMRRAMSGSSFSNTASIISVIIALLAALIVSYFFMNKKEGDKEFNTARFAQTQILGAQEPKVLDILKRALSKDERAVLGKVKKSGEITQDSLRFRLNWSKAKISRILTHLDKMGLIQRQRTGKTYNVVMEGKIN